MAKRNTNKSTINPEIEKAQIAFENASIALQKTNQKIAEDLRAHFQANNGCDNCGGRGWVVTWDTLDSLSGCYAEYGGCSNPNCTPDTRAKSGVDPLTWSKYDDNRGTKINYSEKQIAAREKAERKKEEARRTLEQTERLWAPSKGKLVLVVKESPRSNVTPEGTKGRIFWSGENAYGTRKFGIKDEAGETWWVTEKQIIVIDPKVERKEVTEVTGTFQYEARSGKASQISVIVGKKSLTDWCPNSAWERSEENPTKMFVANWWLVQKGLIKK